MKLRLWLGLAGFSAGLCARAAADEWKIYRFEGRDYVSLANIAEFYAFPAPPPLTLASTAPAAAVPGKPPAPNAAPSTEEAISEITLSEKSGGKSILLDNGRSQLAILPNSREAQINGVMQWLDFPAIVEDGQVLVSRLDLSKTLEPRLRPEKVQGLKPVKTVVLDPGHGGHDNGAASHFGFEKDFALDVALKARQLLEKKGYKVVMTRSADIFIPLPERPAVANHIPDSIFVSIHFNSATSNAGARGFEIYSCAPRGASSTNDGSLSMRDLREEPGNAVDVESTVLSGTIFHSLLGHLPMPDRGIKHARFAVLRLCSQPAVLIECGFVSNSDDSSLIATPAWRAQLADSIVTGIENYKELAEQHLAPKMVADYRNAESAGANATGRP